MEEYPTIVDSLKKELKDMTPAQRERVEDVILFSGIDSKSKEYFTSHAARMIKCVGIDAFETIVWEFKDLVAKLPYRGENFKTAKRVLEEMPEHFEEYATLGLKLYYHDDIAGLEFFRNAPTIIKNRPEHLQEYARIGLKLQKEDRDGDTGTSFWKGAVRVLQERADLFKDYVRLGLEVWDTDRGTGYWFFHRAPCIIQNAPDKLIDYATLGLQIMRHDVEAGCVYFSKTTEHLMKALPTMRKLVDKDLKTAMDFLSRLPQALENLDPAKTYTEEELLLEYIHDPLSAHVVGQIIDKQRYRKQYAKKCQWFYGCRGSAGALPRLE